MLELIVKFSLIQLLICVGLILFITVVLIQNVHITPRKTNVSVTPSVKIPFMNIREK